MSKFFRSASSTSSSASSSNGDHSANDDDDDDDVVQDDHGVADTTSQEVSRDSAYTDEIRRAISNLSLPTSANAPARMNDNRDILVHALLEERCMREVLEELKGRNIVPSHEDRQSIEQMVRAKYQRLCNSLLRHNLIPSGPQRDDFAVARQRVRDGLDLLSREPQNSDPGRNVAFAHNQRRLLTHGGDFDFLSMGLATNPSDTYSLPPSIWPSESQMLHSARYMRDFDEIGMLGKGGFGVVFHVKNRLDGMQYAVKKIPISSARVARIQARGPAEIAELTREVRTLARLDHPNIVRYHAAWVEWANLTDRQRAPISTDVTENMSEWEVNETVELETDMSLSLHRVTTESESEQADIVFEHSTSNRTSQRTPRLSQPSVQYSSTNTVSDVGVNALSRTTGPMLCLHLQMGLYPLTLADFITPPLRAAQPVQPLAHCFHIGPSLEILSAIVAGVEYLHSEEFLHRDLKPANIFMSAYGATARSTSSTGIVDLTQCRECKRKNCTNPVRLNIRVGDLGLVTELARPEASVCTPDSTAHGAVGTEIYRPLIATPDGSAQLDVFALGIIMFELLWRFGTRMERHDCISRLKNGEFPENFSRILHDDDDTIKNCISEMLDGKLKMADLGSRLHELQRSIASSLDFR